jgi:hypothetical protein
MTEPKKMSTREVIAAVVSGAMVISAVVYWIVQIDGVLEMFELAKGG